MLSAILHIGVPKTGTSFIQKWLDQNNHLGGHRWVGTGISHRLAVEFLSKPGRANRSDVLRIKLNAIEQVIDAVTAGPSIILSEYFFEANATHVATFFHQYGVSVTKVIFYLRRQDRWIAASHAQGIKGGHQKYPMRGVGHSLNLDWYSLYVRWAYAFPSAEIIIFDYDEVKRDLVNTFKIAIGASDIQTNDSLPRVNESLDAEMTEVARALNERGCRYSLEALFLEQAKSNGPRFALAPAVIAKAEREFRPSNIALAARFPHLAALAQPGWKADGEDMTGQVDEARIMQFAL